MTRHTAQGIHYVTINGQTHQLCAFGNGGEQIQLLKKIECYAQKHSMEIRYATMPAGAPMRHQDVISAKSDRYEIVVCKVHTPNVSNILFAPKYRVQVHDKEKNETKAYMGTMANLMFDMLNDIRTKKK